MLLPAEFRWFREYWRDCLLYDDVPCDPEAYEESCTIRINAVLPRMKLQRVRGIFQCFKKHRNILPYPYLFGVFKRLLYVMTDKTLRRG